MNMAHLAGFIPIPDGCHTFESICHAFIFTNRIGEWISDFIVLFLSIVSYEQYDVKHPAESSFIHIIMHNK